MTLTYNHVVYPEGDIQEIPHHLRINQIVDLNGNPLSPPLPTVKMIVYRVYKKRTEEARGEVHTLYYLELLKRNELIGYL